MLGWRSPEVLSSCQNPGQTLPFSYLCLLPFPSPAPSLWCLLRESNEFLQLQNPWLGWTSPLHHNPPSPQSKRSCWPMLDLLLPSPLPLLRSTPTTLRCTGGCLSPCPVMLCRGTFYDYGCPISWKLKEREKNNSCCHDADLVLSSLMESSLAIPAWITGWLSLFHHGLELIFKSCTI